MLLPENEGLRSVGDMLHLREYDQFRRVAVDGGVRYGGFTRRSCYAAITHIMGHEDCDPVPGDWVLASVRIKGAGI